MELLEQADYLQEKLENPPRPIKKDLKLKSYLFDILQGLSFLHSQSIVHLDLKPSNLYCFYHNNNSVRRVKIGDFGLAKTLTDGRVQLDHVCGTFGFIAPEVKKGSIIDCKADIWGLGITLYFMSMAYMPHHVKGYKYGQAEIPFRQ